jgi:hypothetical protein
MPRDVLLIGSIPLGSARAVFETVGAVLDGRVRRVPDGENGERLDWVAWQAATFARIPFVEAAANGPAVRGKLPQFRVRPGFPPTTVRFGSLGYVEAAAASYRDLVAVRNAGKLPAGCRLQVGLATPLSVVGQFVDAEFQSAVEPQYERRMLEEVDAIAGAVPPADLSIQWNLATELSILEGHRPVYFDKVVDGIIDRLVRLIERVPEAAEVGLHFCYDDFILNGLPLPDSLDRFVDLANGALSSAARSVQWLHLPVRHGVSMAAYLAPLRRLTLPQGAELYLGLVHGHDGLAGAGGRVALARREIADFGVASECGLRDASPQQVRELLELHRSVADLG